MWLKKIYQKFNKRYVFNSLVRYNSESLGEYLGVTDYKRGVPVIVVLSAEQNEYEDLIITIYSLLNQAFKPDRIILYIDNLVEDSINTLPYDITRFLKNGLEIELVQGINQYTNIHESLKKYSNSIIVSAKNKIYYSSNWLKKLYYSYISYPEDIHTHIADKVIINKQKKIERYENWEHNVFDESSNILHVPNLTSGILIPPSFFSSEALREDIFQKVAPDIPDIWYWILTIINNKKIRVVKKHIKTLSCTDFIYRFYKYIFDPKNRTKYSHIIDIELEQLMKYYGPNLLKKIL